MAVGGVSGDEELASLGIENGGDYLVARFSILDGRCLIWAGVPQCGTRG